MVKKAFSFFQLCLFPVCFFFFVFFAAGAIVSRPAINIAIVALVTSGWQLVLI